MARLILLRHGETDWSRDSRWQGHSDVPLNATGLAQAAALVAPLAAQRPTHLASSDLSRAVETLRPLAEHLGVRPVADPGLREIDVGSWSGLTHDEAAERDPEGVARHDAGGTGWSDGETYDDVAARGLDALERITAPLDERDLLVVVAHGGLIGAVVGRMLGLTADEQRRRLGRPSHGHATYARRAVADDGPLWRILAYNAPLLADAGPPVELTIH
jgi:broad specificity phosphatase PhoE